MGDDLCLEWKNIQYSVPIKKKKSWKPWKRDTENHHQKILKNVSGCLDTGDLVAILGGSGAGKTTLLAAVSQRIRGDITGDIILNGVSVTQKDMPKISCFLPQFEIPAKTLTAYEHLYFMCQLKMDRRTLKFEKVQKVNELLFKVGLNEKSNTMIFLLSGGERKRLALAEELITDPPFVFCDEPTTGLDSYNAYSVVNTLRQLTTNRPHRPSVQFMVDNIEMQVMPNREENPYERILKSGHSKKAVMCSIHQPTSDVFEFFTHIILVSSGHVVYQGSSDDACLFFSKLGMYCPRNCNPADFYIKLIADDENNINFSDIIRNNYEQERTQRCKMRINAESLDICTLSESANRISWCSQVFLLVLKAAIESKRTFRDIFTKTSIFMITAITLAIMYSNVTGLSQSSIQDIQGSMFLITTEVIFTFSYAVIYDFPSMLPIIRREVGENLYSLSAYYVAEIISALPKAFISSYIFLAIVYASLGISKGFMVFLSMGLTISLSAVTATAYGLLLSSIFESTKLAAEIASPSDIFFVLFGGLYYNIDTIPYAKYSSLFYYVNEALSYEYWHDIASIECSQNAQIPCMRNGTEVLKNFSFSTHPFTIIMDYIGLGVLFVIMHIFTFINVRKYSRRVGYY